MRLLISGGGTAGHVYPALAVVEALRSERPTASVGTDAAGLSLTWVGSAAGLEADIVRRSEIPFRAIGLKGGLRGVGPLAALRGAVGLALSLFQAAAIIRSARPQAILATGGYVSVPAVVAGWLMRTPALLYLPDMQPGWAMRFLAPFARRIAVTTDESRRYFSHKKVFVSGYPVRASIFAQDRAAAREAFGLQPQGATLLVFGGSRGSHNIDVALLGALAPLLQTYQVIHVTGQKDAAEVRRQRERLAEDLRPRYRPYAFLHDDMAKALAAADMVICRAGASVLGEIPAASLAAILIPYAGGHRDQERNAAFLQAQGAAVVLDDGTLSSALLLETIDKIAEPDTLAAMRKASAKLARPDASSVIAAELTAIARR